MPALINSSFDFLPLANQNTKMNVIYRIYIYEIALRAENLYTYINCVFQILSPPVICFNVLFLYVSMAFASISMHQIASNLMRIETSDRLF